VVDLAIPALCVAVRRSLLPRYRRSPAWMQFVAKRCRLRMFQGVRAIVRGPCGEPSGLAAGTGLAAFLYSFAGAFFNAHLQTGASVPV